MHGIDKIEKEINNDENLKNTIETLKKKLIHRDEDNWLYNMCIRCWLNVYKCV